MDNAAILTGDLIDSTKAGPDQVRQAMEVIKVTAQTEIGKWFKGPGTRFTRFRGDGWQVVVCPANLAPRAALLIGARLRAARLGLISRISIGFGRIDDWGTDDLSSAAGPALVASGHGLDAIRIGKRLSIAGENLDPRDKIIMDLLEAISDGWTPEQAEALAMDLHPDRIFTQLQIAGTLGISRQAVNYRLYGAKSQLIKASLRAWEENMQSRGF